MSLSRLVLSAGFSTLAAAEFSLEATFASFQGLNTDHDTNKFLETCLNTSPRMDRSICRGMCGAVVPIMNSAS